MTPSEPPARDDRDLAHRIRAVGEHAHDRVTALVVGGAAPVFRRHHDLPLGAEDDPLERVGEIGLVHLVMVTARGEQRRLVHEVREIGSDHSRRRRRDPAEVDVGRERDVPRMHLEDLLPACTVGRLHRDAAVEPAGPEQRLVEHVGTVGRADHDHACRRVEAVHLGEDLVQRLLALVVAAAEAGDTGRARASDRVELVDEHDRRRRLLRLREQIAHTGRADSDDRLDELRRGHGEERRVRLARHGAGQQRLPRPRRPRQQHSVRDVAAEPDVLVRLAQEVDHLRQLRLRLVDAGHVREGHLVARRLVPARPRAAE